LLWKDEAISVLDDLGLAKGWRNKRIKQIHQRLAAELPLPVLSARVRAMLRRRIGWLGDKAARQLDVTIDGDLDPVL
jgi:hypothetical protein